MFDFLTEPYPLEKNTSRERVFIWGSGIFVALFLIVFQPFGTREFHSEYKYLFLAGYGLVISLTIWGTSILFPFLFPKFFKEESWTVGKHILYLLVEFSLVFLACYIYKDLFLGQPISWKGFLGFYPLALAVAVFPILGLVFGDYILRLKRYTAGAEKANLQFSEHLTDYRTTGIVIPDENGNPGLEVQAAQVLFVQAADNYVEIHYLADRQVNRCLIRNSLSAMEDFLSPYGFLRCHRSFIINPAHVEKVTGNAQGYRLHFAPIPQSVPVARSRGTEVLEKLQ